MDVDLDFEKTSKEFNTLMTIETKGENTLIMADCLRALQQLAQSIEIIEEKEEKGE